MTQIVTKKNLDCPLSAVSIICMIKYDELPSLIHHNLHVR